MVFNPAAAARLPLSALRAVDSPRRAGTSDEHVRILAATNGPIPPVLVQRGTNRIVDGLHRVRAAHLRGETAIDVVFFDGDDDDAFMAAVRANVTHGLPLTLSDRKAAAERILRHRPTWSDRSIAAIAGLSPKTVAALRRTSACPPVEVRVGRDGLARPVDPTCGRERVRAVLAERPTASSREVSAEAGVSVATVRRERRAGAAALAPPAAPDAPTALPPVRALSTARGAPEAMLRRLRDDPALRFSENGRVLLRLLAPAVMDGRLRDVVVATVPDHDLDAVRELAALCVVLWQDMLGRLDERCTNEEFPRCTPELSRRIPAQRARMPQPRPDVKKVAT